MKPVDQQIAMAESLGWKLKDHLYDDGSSAGKSWVDPSGVGRALPDYPNDLNAMHEVENWLLKGPLTDTLGMNYWNNLWMACGDEYKTLRSIGNATSTQRAEAFLKTIGKWRDE